MVLIYSKKYSITGIRREPIRLFFPVFRRGGNKPIDVDTISTSSPIGFEKINTNMLINNIINIDNLL